MGGESIPLTYIWCGGSLNAVSILGVDSNSEGVTACGGAKKFCKKNFAGLELFNLGTCRD